MNCMENPIIEAKNLQVRYGHTQAVKGVNLPIYPNRITALIGASGSGKSSFLRAMNRMLDVTPGAKVDGTILFEGMDICHKDHDVINLRKRVGMVFQNPTPFPMSIFENVAYGLRIHGADNSTIGPVVEESLREAALWDEVADRLHESALRLSGGQQQRLCIARAIAIRPTVLLLDEPCSALDPIATKKIESLLLNLKNRYTIAIVTHNLHQARRISDNVAFFHLGMLVEHGTADAMFCRPNNMLTKAYIEGQFG